MQDFKGVDSKLSAPASCQPRYAPLAKPPNQKHQVIHINQVLYMGIPVNQVNLETTPVPGWTPPKHQKLHHNLQITISLPTHPLTNFALILAPIFAPTFYKPSTAIYNSIQATTWTGIYVHTHLHPFHQPMLSHLTSLPSSPLCQRSLSRKFHSSLSLRSRHPVNPVLLAVVWHSGVAVGR